MIRLKRAFVICMAVMLGTICAAGCASDEKKEDSKLPGYVVYTANSSGTGLDSERYEIIETEADDVINRLYKLVSHRPWSFRYICAAVKATGFYCQQQSPLC